jgi:hypothetical protein
MSKYEQSIWDETVLLLGTHWELEKVIENMWGTHWERGGNIRVESSYRKYAGSVDWANYIPRCEKKVSLANEIATMGAKCKIKRHPEDERNPRSGRLGLCCLGYSPFQWIFHLLRKQNKVK